MMARWRAERQFTPSMSEDEREARYAGWRRAVSGTLAASGL
jgi:glycerol kinase